MPITKAILTGGGRATRLRPITTTINKHLIPLAGKPMIFHAIEKVVEAGVKEIFINTNPGDEQMEKVIGNGERWGISIKFFEQTGGPQGIAHVVKCAEKFIGTDPFMFYLSDNIVLGSLKPLAQKFETEDLDCLLTLSKVPDPERFGVPKFENGKLVDVFEKPTNPPSDFAVTGIYVYNSNFFKAFDHIQKSARGEYEISDIHSYFLKNNFKVGYEEITGWWKDTGKPNDLLLANQLLLDQLDHEVKIQSGHGTVIKDNVELIGPALIGDNCVLENCKIGPYVTIGNNSMVKNMAIKDSIIFNDVELVAPIKLQGSIVGNKARILKHDVGNFYRAILGEQTLVEL
jgi:glucose-1-phosphate thymidylyltransferase